MDGMVKNRRASSLLVKMKRANFTTEDTEITEEDQKEWFKNHQRSWTPVEFNHISVSVVI